MMLEWLVFIHNTIALVKQHIAGTIQACHGESVLLMYGFSKNHVFFFGKFIAYLIGKK